MDGQGMQDYIYEAGSEADTRALADWLAQKLEPGSVIALEGDLGAGKTRFTQMLAEAIGIEEIVNSPTFTIIKEYAEGKLPLYHMDAYRISGTEAAELGLDEYFYGRGVTVVEWAGRLGELLPERLLHIAIKLAGTDARVFRLHPHGEPYTAWCDELRRTGVLQ